MTSPLYSAAYRGYHLVFRAIGKLPPPWPQRFERAAHALKRAAFPGDHDGGPAPAPVPAPAPAPPSPAMPPPAAAATLPAAPDWAIEEMKKIALEIDPALYPYPDKLAAMQLWTIPVHYEGPGLAYARTRAALRHGSYTHLFLLPWLKTGGLDLAALRFIEAAAGDPAHRVLVVTTEDAQSPWASRLAPGVELAELGRMTAGMEHHERARILVRLALQLGPRVVHVINSTSGWEMVRLFGKAVRSHARLYASCVCDDRTEYGTLMSYARLFLGDTYPHLSAVIADTEAYPRTLAADCGLPPSLFRTVRVPADLPAAPAFRADAASRRVLWAGRIDTQKRPDVLAAIAARMPDWEFHVFGSAVMGDGRWLPALERLPNVRVRGPFSGFASIPDEGWACFLYTSAWDGLPNVLLEATAAGLPVVAPDVGGVGEFIDAGTGWLVPRFDDADAYVGALAEVGADPARAEARWRAAADRVATRHSREAFRDALAALPGYLSPEAPAPAVPAAAPARREPALATDLVIDVGMHHGQDTEFYLKKGFRVVAIEANPDFCVRVGERLKDWVDRGRLVILNVGVGVEPGVMDFYRNLDKDDWSSFDKAWGTKEGTRAEVIKVRTVDFADVLREHGIPYYLKIDVEGADINVVRSLAGFAARPRYLSVEENRCDYFGELYAAGARDFKLVNQARHHEHPLPNPPREGRWVDQRFELGATGPFGEETRGEWMSLAQALEWYMANVRNSRDERVGEDGWFDIHARFPIR